MRHYDTIASTQYTSFSKAVLKPESSARRQDIRIMLKGKPSNKYKNIISSQAELEPESPAGPPDGGTGVKDWLKQQPGRSI